MKVTLGIFADVEDLDAQGYLKRLAGETGRASVVLTMTPGQLPYLPWWESVSRYANVWLRLNWGYSGRGTLPFPDTPEADEFLKFIQRVFAYEGWLSGVFIGNEPNNPQEWPGGKPLTTEQVARWVSTAWRKAPLGLRVGPPPIDLFNASYGNPYNYLEWMVKGIRERKAWVEFATVQLKTQTSASPLIQERYRFTHPPLANESMNLGASIRALSIFYKYLTPGVLVIPEANPQRKTTSPSFREDDKHYGWPDDTLSAIGWIDSAVRILEIALHAFPIREVYIHVYRWARDEWAIKYREDIKDGLIQVARMAYGA